MLLNDRDLTVLLVQNLGNGLPGSVLNISENLEDIGDIGFELDTELTKISQGSCSLKLFDDSSDSIWTWLQTNIQSSLGVLPPFLMVAQAGVPVFLGIIDPKQIERTLQNGDSSISITSQEWSGMFGKINLDGDNFKRPLPQITVARTVSASTAGYSCSKYQIWNNYNGATNPVASIIYIPGATSFVSVGDKVTSDLVAGTFTVLSVATVVTPWPGMLTGSFQAITLEGFTWPNPGSTLLYWAANQNYMFSSNFTRQASNYTTVDHFTLTQAVSKSSDLISTNTIYLDTISSLVPGDKLDFISTNSTKNNTTFTINDIDAEKNLIITAEKIDVDLAIGDKLYFNKESLNQLVFEPLRNIMVKANTIGNTNFSRFIPASLTSTALSWLPFKVPGSTGETLSTPSDLQPTLTGLMIKGQNSLAWTGTPDTSWTSTSWVKNVIWTNQLVSAPSYLMPDDTATLAPNAPRRNRTIVDWVRKDVDNGDSTYNPADNTYVSVSVVYDYSALRRWVITRTSGTSTITCATATWNGSAWVSPGSPTWSGVPPQSLIPFPAVASSLGSGSSLLCLDSSGVLSIKFGTASASYSLPSNQTGGVLVQTPYGAYLVTSRGYGKVIYSTGTISVNFVDLQNDQKLYLLPSTFCCCDSSYVYVMAGASYTDENNNIANEIVLFKLLSSPDPSNPTAALVEDPEKIFNGVPRLSMAFRDASGSKLVGLLGGRIFQVATNLAETVERYSVQGLTAQQVIENVCMINNCMAIPRPDGNLYIISRTLNESSTNITVDQINLKQSRVSDYFISQVDVSASDSSIAASVQSTSLGGKTLQITSHPFVTTASQCRAIADTYISFFGRNRKQEIQEWSWSGGSSAPWETLVPFQKITVNGGSTTWLVIGMTRSLKDYKATVKLLEY